MKYVPLSLRTSPYFLTGRWQAEAHCLIVGSIPGIRISLAGLTASFGTSTAFMLLPDQLVVPILRALKFENHDVLPPSVSCERRATLTDLTFNLAGNNFTLTPWDWTLEWVFENGRRRCVSALLPAFPPCETDEIFLGSAFLSTSTRSLTWIPTLLAVSFSTSSLLGPIVREQHRS